MKGGQKGVSEGKAVWTSTAAEEKYFIQFMRWRRVKRDREVKIIHYRNMQMD